MLAADGAVVGVGADVGVAGAGVTAAVDVGTVVAGEAVALVLHAASVKDNAAVRAIRRKDECFIGLPECRSLARIWSIDRTPIAPSAVFCPVPRDLGAPC